ncbi:MAG: lipid-A-disaccharide synthase [Xanthobacteraceae bacterium]
MSEIFLVAAEASGDRLGASLMAALKRREPSLTFRGVGGEAMAQVGLSSLYPMAELSVFGFADVIKSISRLRARIRETVEAVVAQPPAALILIDSFGLSFRIAKRVRKCLPHLPIIKYVAPQVWVWRQYRAAAMKPYFDHTLALFPFEPEVHRNLGGPPCTYIGHPILEELPRLRPDADEAARRERQPPVVVVMPGSRRSELRDLMVTFGEVVAGLKAQLGAIEVLLPTLPHLKPLVEEAAARWSVAPKILSSEEEKFAAMRVARVAIAASGTATLELALAGVPHVGAYRIRWWEAAIARMLVQVNMALLPNILLNERMVPELLQEDCTAGKITDAALPLFGSGPERHRQIEAFSRLDVILATPEPPSDRAAAVVLQILADSAAKMH